MRHRQDPPPTVRTLALHQAGVVTSEQARSAGLSRHAVARLVRDGAWSSPGYGIYCVAPEISWEGLAWAGHLLGGERSRLAAVPSAYVVGLIAEAPDALDVLVPHTSMMRSRGPWTFRRERPGARGPGTVGSPPRLTAEDTVLDLADVSSEAELVSWVTRAVQRRLTTPRRLQVALDARSRARHRTVLTALLADVAVGAESPLEIRYLREVERAHGLPPGRRQRSRSGLPYRVDVVYDPYRLIVELDGRAGHEGDGQFRDMNRDNLFVLDGRPTLRFGWFDVLDHPCVVASQVAQGLSLCGWPGLPSRCGRCSRVPAGSWPGLP